MEEIDLRQGIVMNQGNENTLDQSLENLSVMDLQSQDQALEVFVAARDGQISNLTDILEPLSEEVRRAILGKNYVDGEQSCSLEAGAGGGRIATAEVIPGLGSRRY